MRTVDRLGRAAERRTRPLRLKACLCPSPSRYDVDYDQSLNIHPQCFFEQTVDLNPALLRDCLEWVEVPGGQTLMTQGDAGDAMYLVLSGRLRAYVNDEDGIPRTVAKWAAARSLAR